MKALDEDPQEKYRAVFNPQEKYRAVFNPQGVKELSRERHRTHNGGQLYGGKRQRYTQKLTGFPVQLVTFDTDRTRLHPTQKPVDLLEYLIKTYTDEGMSVLDCCMGSGSTGVACVNTGRNFIGIEMDDKYFQIASERIAEAHRKCDKI